MGEVHIGTLGNIHEQRSITFDWFNGVGDAGTEKVRVSPTAGELDYVEFLAKAEAVDEGDEVEGMKVIMGFLRDQIDERDWELFWRGAKAGRQTIADLINVSKCILEATADFPTGPPSESSRGRGSTRRKSKATSSAKASSSKEDRATTRALVLLQGRPDLQTAVVRSAQGRQRRQLAAG